MTNVTRIQVRYAETDQMGLVHHANYFVWMELGRTNLLRESGISYRELEAKGVILPVTKAFAKYVSPSFYDDEIEVHSTLTKLSGPKIRIDYRIFRKEEGKKETLVCAGFTEHACLSRETRKIVRIPDEMADKVVIPHEVESYITRV